mmetsp:Transcript_16811/g.50200  ORF Transcript_16811/g.50200 Transcript_16811/m.50200 type:complete len:235 (+) Transcript_16811:124-828(+)
MCKPPSTLERHVAEVTPPATPPLADAICAPPPPLRLARGATTRMPTRFGAFEARCYTEESGQEHLVLFTGDLTRSPLARVHSECATGDIFGSRRCDCGEQLHRALAAISEAGAGVLVYVRGHEGRGIGLGAKLEAYALQDAGRDTIEANEELGHPVDARNYGAAAAMLRDLGATSVRLMTNNPRKCDELARLGVAVAERVPLVTEPTADNLRYLRTKQDRMGHDLGLPGAGWAR